MLEAEGLERVFARHDRHAEATRRAARAWGLELLCADPSEYSSSLTAVLTPSGHDAGGLLDVILERFDMALGVGLGKLAGRVFRIGHLGDFNDLSLLGTLAGVEMGLELADIPASKRRRRRRHDLPGVLCPPGRLGGSFAMNWSQVPAVSAAASP